MKRTRSSENEKVTRFQYAEWMKADLAEAVAGLYKSLLKNDVEDIGDSGASVLILNYLLCENAGVSFSALESRAKWKIGNSLSDMQGEEDSQLLELKRYLEQQKR